MHQLIARKSAGSLCSPEVYGAWDTEKQQRWRKVRRENSAAACTVRQRASPEKLRNSVGVRGRCETVPTGTEYLDILFPIDSINGGGFRNSALLEEACHWGRDLRDLKPYQISSLSLMPVCAWRCNSCACLKMWRLSFLLWTPLRPCFPCHPL